MNELLRTRTERKLDDCSRGRRKLRKSEPKLLGFLGRGWPDDSQNEKGSKSAREEEDGETKQTHEFESARHEENERNSEDEEGFALVEVSSVVMLSVGCGENEDS